MIDRIRYGQFASTDELRYLEGQRALLHQQLLDLLGREVTVSEARTLALQAQTGGEYDL